MSKIKNTPEISVVIGTYNQAKLLPKIVASYASQDLSPEKFEVIIVDSSSTDATKELLESYTEEYSWLRYFIQKNTGKAAARNRAVKESLGKYIIITDSDMVAHPSFIREHLEANQKAKQQVCFEGYALNLTNLSQPVNAQKLIPQVNKKGVFSKRLGWYWFLTGNLSMPRSLFEQEAGFSTDFSAYGWEDIELGYRLYKKGVPLFYLKKAINYHYHLVDNNEDYQRFFEKGATARIFLKKHPELKYFLGLNPIATFIYRKLKTSKKIFAKIEAKALSGSDSLSGKFCVWLMKEYHYRQGLIG